MTMSDAGARDYSNATTSHATIILPYIGSS